MLQPVLRIFAATSLLISAQPATQAETSKEVQQRLDLYRQREQETLEWQQRRRAIEYALTWKRYGELEVNNRLWSRQGDGTWITEARCFVSARQPPMVSPRITAALQPQNLDPLGSLAPPLRPILGGSTAPLRPHPDMLVGLKRPPLFGEALAELICEGATPPRPHCNRVVLRGGSSSKVVIRCASSGKAGTTKSSHPLPNSDEHIAVNCISLMVNRKAAYMDWGKWSRPEPGSPHEQLVIDRCAT